MKTYLKHVVLIFLAVLLGEIACSQYRFPEKENCEQLKSRTLAVLLFDESDPNSKPYNDAIKKAYSEEWKITPVEYVSRAQYDEIVSTGNTKYAAIYQADVTLIYTQEYTREYKHYKTEYSREFQFKHFDVILNLITAPGKTTKVTGITFCNSELLPSEFFYAGQQLQRLVSASLENRTGKAYYDAEINVPYIKSKKFLIPKEMFRESDIQKLGEKYEYPYEVTDYLTMDSLVLAKSPDYVYPKIIWSDQHRAYGWISISTADGAVLSFMGFSGLAVGTNEKPNEVLKPGNLRNAVNMMMQKTNNKYD
jgi:hypothetical protein